MSDLYFEDAKKIAIAVVHQAVKDARAGNHGAVTWFSTKEAELYLAALDLDPEKVLARACDGFPSEKRYKKMPVKETSYQLSLEF